MFGESSRMYASVAIFGPRVDQRVIAHVAMGECSVQIQSRPVVLSRLSSRLAPTTLSLFAQAATHGNLSYWW